MNKRFAVARCGSVLQRQGVPLAAAAMASVIMVLMCLIQAIATAGEPPGKNDPVRKLAVKLEPMAAATLMGKSGVTIVTTKEEIGKQFGRELAKQLDGQVDFPKEKLVFVGWNTSGPPFGALRYEIKEECKGGAVEFYVEEPKFPPGRPAVRGQALRLGTDFFAVGQQWQARFGKPR